MNAVDSIWTLVNRMDLFYAGLAVFFSVFAVALIRYFGNLPVGRVGTDLNLLTYGFLWDTALKALRPLEYWPRFQQDLWPINKGTTLLVIATCNLILMGFNMKLADRIDIRKAKAKATLTFTERIGLFGLQVVSLTLGLTSLLAFLMISSIWG